MLPRQRRLRGPCVGHLDAYYAGHKTLVTDLVHTADIT